MATFIASGAVSMLLMDSTIWIDYFNGVASSQTDDLDRILDLKLILVGDLILAEVLQGFRAEPGYARIAQRSATRGGVPPALPLAQPCAR